MKNYQDDRYEPRQIKKILKNLIVISSRICKASTCQLMICTFKQIVNTHFLHLSQEDQHHLTQKQKKGKLDYTAQKKAKVNGRVHYKRPNQGALEQPTHHYTYTHRLRSPRRP